MALALSYAKLGQWVRLDPVRTARSSDAHYFDRIVSDRPDTKTNGFQVMVTVGMVVNGATLTLGVIFMILTLSGQMTLFNSIGTVGGLLGAQLFYIWGRNTDPRERAYSIGAGWTSARGSAFSMAVLCFMGAGFFLHNSWFTQKALKTWSGVFPMYPNATLLTHSPRVQDFEIWMFRTTDPVASVRDFYRKDVADATWKVTTKSEASEPSMTVLENGDLELTVVISKDWKDPKERTQILCTLKDKRIQPAS